MKKYLLIVIRVIFMCQLLPVLVQAQEGDYLITNHKPEIHNIDNLNFQVIQDRHGLMYIANRRGVLVYDGLEWDFYGTPGAALSIAFNADGELFVGCLNDFGKIAFVNNSIKYVSLSSEFGKSFGMIYQVLRHHDKMVFVGEQTLYIYDEETDKTDIHLIENSDNFYNLLFPLNDKLYANISDGSISRLNDEFTPDSTYTLPDLANLSFIRQHEETGAVIAGTFNSNLFSIKGGEIRMLPYSYYFSDNNIQIIDGQWYDADRFVVGTLEKGCMIMDVSGKSQHVDSIDFSNGLPDNEVSSLFIDNSKGIWVAHEFGLSRIAPEIPIKSITHYPGIQGNLFAIKRYNNRTYISTSVGVYYFDEEKKYKRTVYYVQKRPSARTKTIQEEKPAAAAATEQEAQVSAENRKSGRKGFLGIFKSRKKAEEKQTELATEQVATVTDIESDATSKPGLIKRLFSRKDRGGDNEFEKITQIPQTDEYLRKERKILQSVEYLYKPVEGIQAKCKQLVVYRDKLLAVSTSGVFEIDNASASIVINEPVRFLYNDLANDRLIMSGYDRSVKVYKLIGDVWVELHDQSFNEIISSIGMDNNNRLWLAGPRLLYKITLSDEEFTIDQSFPIQNQMMDIPLMSLIKNQYYFIYSMGYYYFDGDTVREDLAFKEALGLPIRSLQSADGLTWIFNGKIWNRVNPDGKIEAFEYLSLFPDIKYIDFNSEQDVFAILTQENKTYLYSHAEDHSFQPVNDLILKRITTNNGVVSLNSRIVLTYEDNSLSFKFTEPDYLGLLNVEYQYILKDEMKVWSDWTQLNSVNFSYLSPGIYSLTVRARDTFDRVKEAREIEFRVRAPYWKRPWFYALEILLVGAMMVVVKRLRRVNIRYPWIADGLGIFTLIIIIAMIQSTVTEYLMIESTPIIDLGINVVTALIAFPLEQKLRKILI
jgi:hypothetical protein